nr:hypothetical protein [Deltaproteobacteria bacterium]
MMALLLAPTALAQEASAWRPAAGAAFGRGGTLTESARIAEDEAAIGLTSVLAEGDAVGGFGLVAIGSVAAGDRIRVDLSVPAWLYAEAPGFSGPATGDVGVQAVVPVVRGKAAFSVIPRVLLPTGTDAAGLEGGPGAGLLLAVAG